MMGQMKLNARVTPATLDLVRAFEPVRLQAELQSDGHWVIGYGHTRFAREGATITPEDADALLRYDLSETADVLDGLVTVSLSQSQFEAINAFALHIGLDNFRRSTVLRSLNAGAFESAAAAMDLWRGAGASPRHPPADLLARRRAAERAHFLGRPVTASEPPVPVETPGQPILAAVPAPVPELPPEARLEERTAAQAAPVFTPVPDTEPEPVADVPAAPEPVADVPVAPVPEAIQPARWTPPPRPSRKLRVAAPRKVEPSPVPSAPEGPPEALPETLPEIPPEILTDVPCEIPAGTAPPTLWEPPPVSQSPETVMPSDSLAEAFEPADPEPPMSPVPPVQVPVSSFGREPAELPPMSSSAGITVDLPQPRPLGPAPGPTTRLTYALVGLLGVMLFAGALVSMFRQANVANLVTGLAGVAFMAPAAGHFLFTVLSGSPDRVQS